jgi:hypothetical protein
MLVDAEVVELGEEDNSDRRASTETDETRR